MESKVCYECGQPLNGQQTECPNCGAPIRQVGASPMSVPPNIPQGNSAEHPSIIHSDTKSRNGMGFSSKNSTRSRRKQYVLLGLFVSVFVSVFFCIDGRLSSSSYKHRELYGITDRYVDSLYTTYESYGLVSRSKEYTSDGKYRVMPIGRLVNVRIESYDADDDSDYKSLLKNLQKHYHGDSRVKDVYRCQAGTLMIDCRN